MPGHPTGTAISPISPTSTSRSSSVSTIVVPIPGVGLPMLPGFTSMPG